VDTNITYTNTSYGTTTSATVGATIAGSESSQKFRVVDYEFEEDAATVLELRLMGI
jgi:hypothetical protein